MKEYFILQCKLLIRKLRDFGLPPILSIILIAVVFVVLSNVLFVRASYANCFYVLLALFWVARLSEPKRSDFLKTIYFDKKFKQLRCLENVICISPFFFFLVFQYELLSAFALLVLAIPMALKNFKIDFNFAVLTPFYKKPFEFLIGFRKTYVVFIVSYLLTIIAIAVGNFNLAIFQLILISLVSYTFYSKPETECFVWIFNLSAKQFLWQKVKTGSVQLSLLSLPVLIALAIFFFDKLYLVLAVFIVCQVYLVAIIFAKYSAYPKEVSIRQAFLIALSFIFPPSLLGIIPLLYSQSRKRLKQILG